MNELEELIRENGQYIYVFIFKEVLDDSEERNVTLTKLSPIPIKALVSDLTPTQMQWKTSGIVTSRAKEIICDSKHLNLILQSHKIEIDGNAYVGWKDNNKLVYKKIKGYIQLYVYSK